MSNGFARLQRAMNPWEPYHRAEIHTTNLTWVMIGIHSYIIDLSSDGKWANEQRQTDEPGYNEDIIHTFMNGLPFKPCNTTLYTGNYANDSHRTDSQHNSSTYFQPYRVALWCKHYDSLKHVHTWTITRMTRIRGHLHKGWMHVITPFRHEHTCNTPRSKITGTYKVVKRKLLADGTEPTWRNRHLIFSLGIQATFRSWKEAQSRKHSQ